MKIQAILTVLQIANQVVEAVEEVQGNNSGAAKAKLAVDVIGTIYNATEHANKVPYSDLMGQTLSVISALVNFKNLTGKFKKSKEQKAA